MICDDIVESVYNLIGTAFHLPVRRNFVYALAYV